MQAADLMASAALALVGPALAGACSAIARGWLPEWSAAVGGFLAARVAVGALHAALRPAARGPTAAGLRA